MNNKDLKISTKWYFYSQLLKNFVLKEQLTLHLNMIMQTEG